MARDPESFARNAGLIESYPNYKPDPSLTTPEEKVRAFKDHVVRNLLWLFDNTPSDIRDRSRLWYNGARRLAEDLAARYNMSDSSVAGVMAVLSPQKDWFQNVSLAMRTIDIYKTKQDKVFDKKMRAKLNEIFADDKYAELRQIVSNKSLSQLRGMNSDLRLTALAMWVRTYDQTYNSPSYASVSPEGELGEPVKTGKGAEARVAWGSLAEIAKGISVIEDGRKDNVSARVGNAHKVRNFFNNILAPDAKRGDVTIDTHAVAAANLRPLSQKAIEVAHGLGTSPGKGMPGASSSSVTGAQGLYGIYADAYREAADMRGVLPREMQSITWEAIRGLFSPAFKRNQKNIDAANNVWQSVREDVITEEEARERIRSLAGGISAPSWAAGGPDVVDDASLGAADDQGHVSGDELSGGEVRPEGAAAARVGGRDAGTVPSERLIDQGVAALQSTARNVELSARATNTSVPEFTNWWNGGWREGGPKKASIARNKDGSPMPYYHGTGGDQFSAFANATSGAIDSAEGPFFFSPEPSFTDDYTGYSDPATGASPFPGARVIPVFLSVQKPFDSTDPKRQAELIRFMNDLMLSGRVKPDDILFFSAAYPINQAIASGELTPKEGMAEAIAAWRRTLADPDISWKAIEKPIFQKYIRGNGFDSFYVIENGVKNLAVYNPRQIKSIFNKFEPGAATQPEFSARETSPAVMMAAEANLQYQQGLITAKERDAAVRRAGVRYNVVNMKDRSVVGSFGSDTRANADAEKRNLQYGAQLFTVRPVQVETEDATRADLSAREVKTDRIQALEDAARGVRSGTVTREQYEQLVNNLKPVLPYAEVPEPATEAQIIRALELTEPKKVEKAGVPSETLERGHPVGLRLDIPSYTNQNTWVVAVHEVKGQNFYAGTPIGYEPTAIATNVTMGVVPKAAFDIAAGLKNKSTIAVMRGEWQPATPQEAKARADAAMNDPNWAQVGMDPRRHQYFYNRTTMQPVVGADEVIQIGPLVLAKNPVYASKSEFEYSARDIGNETIGNRIQSASPADIRAKQFDVEYTNTADMINRGLRKVPFVGKRVKDTTAEDLIIKMQDRMLPLGRMVDEVRKSGGTVVDASDIYMTEELYHGRAGAAVDDRAQRLYKPVFDAMRTLGVSEKDLDDYLTARHAPERNAFVRSINEDQSKGAGITDREAADIMQRLAPQKAKLDKVAKLVDAIVADTNKTRSGNGLTPDYSKLNSKTNFKHYVPLKGFADEDVFDDRGVESLRARTGQGFKIRGKEDRSVMGRQSRAANVLGNVILQNEESVIRAEKNKVGQALLKLIRDNPQQAGRFAKILEVAPVEPRIVNGKVKLVSSGTYRNRDDVMVVKEGGNEVAVEIYDARIAKALTGATGLGPENSNVLFDAMLKLNRYLAQVNTTLNPEFVISNFARDLQTANINIKQFDVKGLGRKIITDVPSALAGARAGIRDGRTDTKWAKAYDDFRKAGGTSEFLGLRDLEGKIKQINDEVMGNKGPLVARPFKTMLKFIEDYNSVAENGIRLSTFQALRDMGVSDAKAAQVAKNLTVNFNKGGENRVFMNAMYLFYNASIQGSMAMANAITRSKRVRKYVAGIVVAGFMQDVINAMISGMDDDEKKIYDKVPDYVLERNYVMMDPFGFTERGYYAFPMPYGFNAFFNMGRNLARVSRGQGDPMQTAGSIVMGFADAFNPIGGTQTFFNFVAPTILDPLVDLYSNRNFAGRPISPEQAGFGPPSPDSQRFWSNTFPPYVAVSEWLNQITGGTSVIPGAVDISPNTIGYLTNYATGAAGAFAERVAKFGFSTVPDALTGDLENVEMRDIPFVRKLYGNVTRRNDLEAFMENTNKIAQIQREFDQAEKYGQVERIERAMRDYPRELAAAPLIEDMVKERRKITREINEIRRDPNMDEDTKRVLIRALSQEADFYVGQANRIYNTMVRN